MEADQQRLNHLLLKCLRGKKDRKVVEEAAGEVEVVVGGAAGVAEGVEEEVGDICIHIADSLHCTAETNTTL